MQCVSIKINHSEGVDQKLLNYLYIVSACRTTNAFEGDRSVMKKVIPFVNFCEHTFYSPSLAYALPQDAFDHLIMSISRRVAESIIIRGDETHH